MKNYVEGQITANKDFMPEIKNKLESMGYEVNGDNFRKCGQVESVVNELVPLIEKQGIDVWESLHLAEYDGQGNILGRYEKGKVTRYNT